MKKGTKINSNMNGNFKGTNTLPFTIINALASYDIAVGTRNKGIIHTNPKSSQVALLGMVAMQQGFMLELQHSVKQVLSIREKLTGKRVMTVYSNSDKGTGAKVFLNCTGTKIPFDKLETLTGTPRSELRKTWQVAHTGAIEMLANWQGNIEMFTTLLKQVSPAVTATGNKQPS